MKDEESVIKTENQGTAIMGEDRSSVIKAEDKESSQNGRHKDRNWE